MNCARLIDNSMLHRKAFHSDAYRPHGNRMCSQFQWPPPDVTRRGGRPQVWCPVGMAPILCKLSYYAFHATYPPPLPIVQTDARDVPVFLNFLQNFSEFQILFSMCLRVFLAFTLRLSIQTLLSVAPKLRVCVHLGENVKILPSHNLACGW